MRKITTIIIHCAATKPNMDIGRTEIDKWHRAKGFFGIGYHYVIRRDGTIEDGRPIEKIGAHAQGHNSDSIGICLVGGIDENGKAECNFTRPQWHTLDTLLDKLQKAYPQITKIIGHNDVSAKSCPCFNVKNWLKQGKGIAKENLIAYITE